ncbi:MAG: AAA family ATPase [Candidatus Paceibacterota bacterium]|jgi:hypothetical protein
MANPEYHWMYQTKLWKQLRVAILRDNPLCAACMRRGNYTTATVVHHIVAHKGDWNLFSDAKNLESICNLCHNSDMQSIERIGYDKRTEVDGWPLDSEHPFNGGLIKNGSSHYIPTYVMFPNHIPKSPIPLTMVCGAPASGKSTYVSIHKSEHDIVIDLDDILQEMFGLSRLSDKVMRHKGLEKRNRMLSDLHKFKNKNINAWFISGSPQSGARQKWVDMLRPINVLMIMSDRSTCLNRLKHDVHRRNNYHDQSMAVNRWFDNYTPRKGDVLI